MSKKVEGRAKLCIHTFPSQIETYQLLESNYMYLAVISSAMAKGPASIFEIVGIIMLWLRSI